MIFGLDSYLKTMAMLMIIIICQAKCTFSKFSSSSFTFASLLDHSCWYICAVIKSRFFPWIRALFLSPAQKCRMTIIIIVINVCSSRECMTYTLSIWYNTDVRGRWWRRKKNNINRNFLSFDKRTPRSWLIRILIFLYSIFFPRDERLIEMNHTRKPGTGTSRTHMHAIKVRPPSLLYLPSSSIDMCSSSFLCMIFKKKQRRREGKGEEGKKERRRSKQQNELRTDVFFFGASKKVNHT